MKRGAVQKSKSKQVITWFPLALLAGLDAAVQRADLDRSKFIRQAVREKMAVSPSPKS